VSNGNYLDEKHRFSTGTRASNFPGRDRVHNRVIVVSSVRGIIDRQFCHENGTCKDSVDEFETIRPHVIGLDVRKTHGEL